MTLPQGATAWEISKILVTVTTDLTKGGIVFFGDFSTQPCIELCISTINWRV